MATFDHRKYQIKPDPETTQAQRAAFKTMVDDAVAAIRANQKDVSEAINELLNDPTTKTQVGDRLAMKLPAEIEKRLEK